MNSQLPPSLTQLCERLGYSFSEPALLLQAVRHSSYIHEHPEEMDQSYERLEFLGDAVLELVITELLYQRFPEASEGHLSKARAGVVNENRLAGVARSLDLGPCLLLGRGEEMQGGREKPSILADVVEAIAAAVYLDGGLDQAREVLGRLLAEATEKAMLRSPKKDYKTRLQEDVQQVLHFTPVYELIHAEGPDHAKLFTAALVIDGRRVATGSGRSKKEAEQDAARRGLEAWQLMEWG
ncbi:ribonuclease III [Desulfoferula mesophila]|uniref:Ribonuclease 3 n=1 Tax=Desulfoferula mesophila TaxID=3058419 RepID=A0AAU9EB84_9BACT|nr:ribonuclease 3 [Desulfoferula mesophilus]